MAANNIILNAASANSASSVVFGSNERVEDIIFKSRFPIKFEDNGQRTVNNSTGFWLNKSEEDNWRGFQPIDSYPIYNDPNPEVIYKASDKVDCLQQVQVKTLLPPAPQPHGPITIRHDPNILPPLAPAVCLRQFERALTPEPLVFREDPPAAPIPQPALDITIPGTLLPPVPRRVVIEIVKQPQKTAKVLIEKWKAYEEQSRQVIEEPKPADPVRPSVRNLVVIYEQPECKLPVPLDVQYLSEERADPDEYRRRHQNLGRIPDQYNSALRLQGYGSWAAGYLPREPQLQGSAEALRRLASVYLNYPSLKIYSSFFNNNNQSSSLSAPAPAPVASQAASSEAQSRSRLSDDEINRLLARIVDAQTRGEAL